MNAPDGLAWLEALRLAMTTRRGRALAREIAAELKLADEEAAEHDPVGAETARLLAKSRKRERTRRGGR